MNVGVRLEEKEQEKEREDELKRMRDEVELKEELQMRKKLGAQCGTSLNDGTDGELINDKNQDKNITDKVSDSKDQHNKLFTQTELHAQKHDSSEMHILKDLPICTNQSHFRYNIQFTDAHANIVISVIYQSLLMMAKFVSGRIIAPSSKIEAGQDLELSISTNGCFKKLKDMSSNRTKLIELLGCVGEYAVSVSVAHRGYFESKQITPKHGYDEITDEDDEAKMSYDTFIDSIKTGRMNQKLLSYALLQRISCL
ncbi:MAG: hypothetical protein EZS28_008025 [Streblomastix strix]|uniref:Uncharacterized protein n=1 Tax=Streblomastix strix TaxID=222440 RepID=A0A5J4WQT1_9EUKA|nr:MAG: hypothetical protein EZS28_008025 [Streblomastix strix]